MDKRINYRIVLDCETCPLDADLEEVIPSNMFVYDLGWEVTDKRANDYQKRSFVNADIFLHEKALMKSAYYANKIPQYWEDIKSGKRILAKWDTIKRVLAEDMKNFNVKEVYAHNMRFDYGALNNTERWLTQSAHRYFFPYDTVICDTLKMARQVIGKMPTYKRFCETNGFMTKNGQCRFTAEILYKFISKDLDFVESHTGLEDVEIEKEIMAYCFKQHKKMDRVLYKHD